MRKGSSVLAACALALLLAQGAPAATPPATDRFVLTVPRPPTPQEAVWLTVRVGALRRGARLLVLSDDGTLLGAISPFGIVPGRKAGTYTIPLPESAIREGRVSVRVMVEEVEEPTRAATRSEVEDVGLEYVRVGR